MGLGGLPGDDNGAGLYVVEGQARAIELFQDKPAQLLRVNDAAGIDGSKGYRALIDQLPLDKFVVGDLGGRGPIDQGEAGKNDLGGGGPDVDANAVNGFGLNAFL